MALKSGPLAASELLNTFQFLLFADPLNSYFWIPMVAPFLGCTFGGFLYDVLLFTGQSPVRKDLECSFRRLGAYVGLLPLIPLAAMLPALKSHC